jgi:hypothetical protein
MNRHALIAGLVIASVLLAGPGHASYLENDPNAGGWVRPVPPPPPPPRPPGNEITRLVNRLSVGHPYTTRNLTVFPLYITGGTDPTAYATLDEAVGNGWLEVYEKGTGRVQEVLVRNVSRHTIFLMAGEIISGAKQNRVIATDTLLRPNGPEIAVPVYCVERGRWAGRSTAFETEKSFANNTLRYKAQSRAGQDAVWEEVRRVAGNAGVNSATSNFQDVVNDEEVQKAVGEYGDCMPRPPRRCIGAAIVINNRIAGVEVFANEALFAALWPKIRRGYALDAYPLYGDWDRRERERLFDYIDERDVRAFLDRVYDAGFTARGGVDLGWLYTIRGNGIRGEGLVWDRAESETRSVIHVNFAPERIIVEPVRRNIELQGNTDQNEPE